MDGNRHSHPPRRQSVTRLILLLAIGLASGLIGPAPVKATDPTPPLASAPGLNLTPPQQQKLSAMESATRAQAGQLIGQIKQLRGRLSDLYGAYTFDAGEARRLNQEMNRIQGQLLDLRLSEQQQLRGILSPDQFTQLQAAVRQHGFWGDHRSGRRDGSEHQGRDGHGNASPGRFLY